MVSTRADGTPFDPTDTTPAPQAEDVSQPSNLRRAWDIWTSHPSNNAAMLQFGINMLQPRQAGQSALGQVGTSLGSAAEASTRNVEEEEALRKEQEAEALKRGELETKKMTAGAYAKQVELAGKKPGGVSGQIATQRAFNAWLSKPEDPLAVSMNQGKSNDPVVQALQRQFPDIKTKGDLIANPAAVKAARALFGQTMAEPDEDGTPPPARTGAPVTPPPPSGGPGRPVYDQTTGQLKGYFIPGRGYVPNE